MSPSGKTLSVGSTHGNKASGLRIKHGGGEHEIIVGVNAYIKAAK